MFCPHCGKQLPDGSEFCGICGKKIISAAGAAPGAPVTNASAAGRAVSARAAQPSPRQTNPLPYASRRTTAAAASNKPAGSMLVKAVAVAIAAAALWILVSWVMGITGTLSTVVARLSVLEAPQAMTAAVMFAALGLVIALVSLRTIIVVVRPITQELYPARALSHALVCGITLVVLAFVTIALPGIMGGIMPIGFSSQHAQAAIAIGVEPVSVPTFLGAVLVTALSAVGRFVLRANLGDKYGIAYGPKPQEGTYAAEQWEKARRRHRIVAALIAGAVVVVTIALAILIGTGTIPLPELPWSTSASEQSEDADEGTGGSLGTEPAPPEVKQYTNEEMAQEASDVRDGINTVNARYADKDGYIAEKDVPAVLDEVEAYLAENQSARVESTEKTDSALLIKLNSGMLLLYSPRVEGYWAGGTDVLVDTYEPFAADLVYEEMDEYVDDKGVKQVNTEGKALHDKMQVTTAKLTDGFVDIHGHYLANMLNPVKFGSDIDDANVSIDACKSFGPNQIILWEGHGSWTKTTHGLLMTGEHNDGRSGEIVDAATFFQWVVGDLSKYRDDINAGRMVLTTDGALGITTAFFDYYYNEGDLDGTTIYLTACRCMMDDELAKVLVSKGARAVLGYTRSVSIFYSAALRDEIVYQLAHDKTYGAAIKAAQDKYGEYDTYLTADDKSVPGDTSSTGSIIGGARLVLYPEEAGVLPLVASEEELKAYEAGTSTPATADTREIVMALDVSGSMAGTPLDETVKAANEFTDKVFNSADTRMSVVSYSSAAKTLVASSSGAGRIRKALNSLSADGQTNIEGALNEAKALLDASGSSHKVLVLMSDGLPNVGAKGDALVAIADELKANGVLIYTLGFFQNSSKGDKTAGQDLLSRIASAGCHYEVDSEEVLNLFFGDIADIINGVRYMYITVACPVDVSVKYNGETLASSEEGTSARTSFGTITYVNNKDENGNVIYNADGTIDQVKILRLREGGRYTVKIKGTGDGTMTYTIGYLDANGEYADFRTFPGISVTPSMSVRTTAEVSDQTFMEIDQNGDGVVDRQLFAGTNEIGHERDSSPEIMRALLVVGIVGAGIVVVWIGLLVRRFTKRG